MTTRFLVGAALLSVTLLPTASAQNVAHPAAVTHSDLNTLRYNREDTLRAVRHLFMQRSRATQGALQMGPGLLLSGAARKAVATSGRNRRHPEYALDYSASLNQQANQDLVAGALVTGYGFFRQYRFGPQQYQRVVAAYQQGQPLPPYLTRRLKTKYFRLLPIGAGRGHAVRE